MIDCPLCNNQSTEDYHSDRARSYLRCPNCTLIFVPEIYRLSSSLEKAEYDKHQNNPEDDGYRKFLSRTTDPLFNRLEKGMRGLDYGCGPGPTISLMAKEQGLEMANYDLYYSDDRALLEESYDFITMTEVIEHIAEPSKLLLRLNSMLSSGGILAIMTKRTQDLAAFTNWHYKNDPTHICFYSEATFEWIAQKMSWKLEVIDKDVVFFTKSKE